MHSVTGWVTHTSGSSSFLDPLMKQMPAPGPTRPHPEKIQTFST
jgi:hypothetical protein